LKNLDVGGRIILKLILKTLNETVCAEFVWRVEGASCTLL